jgi:hypothetical protein
MALVEQLAKTYFKLLSSIDWQDKLLVAGLREGLNKFLSNAHIALFRGQNKYHKTQYVSQRALERLERREYRGLIWEHLIPKSAYIQEECERRASEHSLSPEFVEALMRKYWHLATITVEEDRLLDRTSMPTDWDELAVFARTRVVRNEEINTRATDLQFRTRVGWSLKRILVAHRPSRQSRGTARRRQNVTSPSSASPPPESAPSRSFGRLARPEVPQTG